jgi:hypothetical protein
MLGNQMRRHLVQRDVPPRLDQPDNEGFMDIAARAAPPALGPRRPFADPGPRDPTDRRRDPDTEPRCRLPGRKALRRGLQNTHPKIVAQSTGHHPPPRHGG